MNQVTPPPIKLSQQPDTDTHHHNHNIFQQIATTIDSEVTTDTSNDDQSNLLDQLSDSDVNDSQFESPGGLQVNQIVDTSSDTETSTSTQLNLHYFGLGDQHFQSKHLDAPHPSDISFSESNKESIDLTPIETSSAEKVKLTWSSSEQLPAMNEAGEQPKENNSSSSATTPSTSNTTTSASSTKKPLGGFKWKKASVRAIELQEIGT